MKKRKITLKSKIYHVNNTKRNKQPTQNKTRQIQHKKSKKIDGQICGGYGKHQTKKQIERETKIKSDFRKMFLEQFQLVKQTVKNERQFNTNVSNLIKMMIALKKRDGDLNTINGLIPITNNYIPIDKEKYTNVKTPLINFVPLLCVLIYNIRNNNAAVKRLIDVFIENEGDINLRSSKHNITAISVAIEIQNRDIVNYLLRKGSIPEEGQELMPEPMPTPNPTPNPTINLTPSPTPNPTPEPIKEEPIPEVEPEKEKSTIDIDIPKLSIPDITTLPQDTRYKPAMEYDRTIEPPFWKPIFGEGELFRLREVLTEMMIKDAIIPYNRDSKNVATPWHLCSIIKQLFPAFYIPKENKPYEAFNHEQQKSEQVNMAPQDYSIYNTILCATMICFGLISEKMKSQDYTLMFKGGKANQLVLSTINTTLEYESDDIDILVIPKEGIEYNREHIENLSTHIGFLLKWLLTSPKEKTNIISVLLPDPSKLFLNPNIVKVSYIKQYNRSRYTFRPISDVDFKELSPDIQPFFAEPNIFNKYIPELDTNIRVICPNITGIIDEKLFYYIKYMDYKNKLESGEPITELGLTIQECIRLSQKLKRSIIAISYALQEQQHPTNNQAELKSLQKQYLTYLLKLKMNNEEDSQIDSIVRELIKE